MHVRPTFHTSFLCEGVQYALPVSAIPNKRPHKPQQLLGVRTVIRPGRTKMAVGTRAKYMIDVVESLNRTVTRPCGVEEQRSYVSTGGKVRQQLVTIQLDRTSIHILPSRDLKASKTCALIMRAWHRAVILLSAFT
jgi:hypothetical protein